MATKERRKTPPGAPKYHRLTEGKRIIIETLRKEGLSNRHIADRVGCSPATVGRELKRNLGKRGYRHKKAQAKANHRAAVKAAKRRKFTEGMWALAKDRLAKGWTFGQIKQALGIEVYFAKPYHSWERGTNENRNGVVRKVLPKGRSFDDIAEEEMRRIDYMPDDRPLKCLNRRTPREAFAALLNRHAAKTAA